MKYWFTTQYPRVTGDGVWVRPGNEDSAEHIERGDQIAIYESSYNPEIKESGGAKAVVVIAEITEKVSRKGKKWSKVAEAKPVSDGDCPLSVVKKIMGVKGIRHFGGKAIMITSEQFEKIASYFPDYRTSTKIAENSAIEAYESTFESDGQGYPSKEIRDAVESYAMLQAKDLLAAEGYANVEDCSKWNPYDLSCTRSGNKYFVEVKGTQTGGASVLVSANEVKHARQNKDRAILVLVSDIRIQRDKNNQPVATGGNRRIFSPWNINERKLEPIAYRLSLAP